MKRMLFINISQNGFIAMQVDVDCISRIRIYEHLRNSVNECCNKSLVAEYIVTSTKWGQYSPVCIVCFRISDWLAPGATEKQRQTNVVWNTGTLPSTSRQMTAIQLQTNHTWAPGVVVPTSPVYGSTLGWYAWCLTSRLIMKFRIQL